MKMEIFSVYDKAVQAFLPPFMVRSKGEALRSFTEACNDQKHQFWRHAADYTLMSLGSWDDASGIYESCDPQRVVGAYECVADDPFTPDKKVGNGQTELSPKAN